MTSLFDYDTQYLLILRAIILFPGIKVADLADQTGIHSNSVLRYTAKLSADGWILRREARLNHLNVSQRNLTPPYLCYPAEELTLEAIQQALDAKLAQTHEHPVTQEYLRLIELTQDNNLSQPVLNKIIGKWALLASEFSQINQDFVKLQPLLHKFMLSQQRPDKPKSRKG